MKKTLFIISFILLTVFNQAVFAETEDATKHFSLSASAVLTIDSVYTTDYNI
jgi:hypothetical protein